MKILVTGSRDWNDTDAVEREFRNFLPASTVLVHGACPTGADAIAHTVGTNKGFEVRQYPADWENDGKAGGPKRNAKMIRTEHRKGDPIDLCIAFTNDLERSRGTRDCVLKAKAAGIKVKLVSAPERVL